MFQSFIIAVIAMAFVLGVMIIIHELGHHLVAKLFGVRVETFSVGFGKRLFGFRMGDTDYRLSALPFGGYGQKAGGEAPGLGAVVAVLVDVDRRLRGGPSPHDRSVLDHRTFVR